MAKEKTTKLCKYCKTEIPADAKVCPQCGKKQGLSLIWKVLIVLLVVGVIGAAAGGGGNSESGSTTPKKEETPIEYVSVTVSELHELLEENALKAEDTYKGKYVELTGVLSTIDSSGKYITLGSGDVWDFKTVQCYIKNDEQKSLVMEMSKGNTVVLKGKIKSVGEVLGYSLDITEIVSPKS